jgi:Domain of unknown function (DUF4160)
MPTILTWGKTRVAIYTTDHRPSHVHVLAPDRRAVFWLRCPGGPPELREALGYRLTELNRIAERLTDALAELCREWERIHGDH